MLSQHVTVIAAQIEELQDGLFDIECLKPLNFLGRILDVFPEMTFYFG